MISVVVPCYNEEKNIHGLVVRFADIAGKLSAECFELVLVDNGSSDGTSAAIDTEIQNFGFIKKVSVTENKGYGFGVLEGLKACGGEWLGWIHADLQLPPEAFLEFDRIIKENQDKARNIFFKGRRRNRPFSDAFFTIGMGIFESLYFGARLWDIYAQPTLLHRNLYEKISSPPYDFSLDLYMYLLARKSGMTVRRVPVVQQKREEGKSSWNNGKLRARMNFVKNTIVSSIRIKSAFGSNEK